MKHTPLTTASLLALFSLAPATLAGIAQELNPPVHVDEEKHSGTIRRVAEDGTSFVLESQGTMITIHVNDSTEYLLDGESSSRERTLVVGRTAQVTVDGEIATKVSARTGS